MDDREDIDELVERITETVLRYSRDNSISWKGVLLSMAVSMTLLTEDHCKKYGLRPDQIHTLHAVSGEALKAALVGTNN